VKRKGAIWIMVGRTRKIGKRERNGRISRAETKVDHVRFMEGFIADPTVIYVLDAPPLVKVGISKQPRGRVKQIQTGNGQIVRMYWYRWMDGKDAKKVELEFHRQYQGGVGHSHGEWYYLSPASAVDRVTQKIRQLGMFSVHESSSKEVERTLDPQTKRWG
jgi:hypothetical protein